MNVLDIVYIEFVLFLKMFLMDKEKLDADIALALYIGMIHDTGVFQYSNTSKRSHEIMAALYDAGINIQMINTSEKGVSAIIDQQKANAAVRAIHDKFFSDTF